MLNQIEYPPRLNLARIPTPLQFLSRASEKWGSGKRIWIKRDDLTGSTLSGNKIRKLEFIAAHALHQGCKTLVTCGGIQSNHCRATALVAAQLGLDCHLVLRADDDPQQNTGNFLLDQLAGASFDILPAEEWVTNLKVIYARLESRFHEAGRPALMIPTGGSDSLGVWGYIAAAEELRADLKDHHIEKAALTLATGSAGTQTGLTAGASIFNLPLDVVAYAICDDADWFNRRVTSDWQASQKRWPQLPKVDLTPRTRDHSVGNGYGRAEAPVYQLISELARLEGIVLDPVYTGKAFHGLLADLRDDFYSDVDDIIFVHTGGVFGLFAHEAQLMSAVSVCC